MLFEWRIYEVVPGRMSALHRRFAEETLPLWKRHDIHPVGFWETVIGKNNRLYYLLAWRDLAHRERSWSAFQNDPDWQRVRQESERDGPLIASIKNTILRATPYSPPLPVDGLNRTERGESRP